MTAHEDRWRDVCPSCGIDDYHVIVREGPRRMEIRCQDCDRRWVLCSPAAPFPRGYRSRNAVDVDVAAAVEAYEAGATVEALARLHQVAYDTMRRRLIAAGVVMRPRQRSLVPGGGCVERAAETRRRACDLRRKGVTRVREAAGVLGVSEMTVRRAWRSER